MYGRAARVAAAAGRAVPPRVDPRPSTAPRWSRTSWRDRRRTPPRPSRVAAAHHALLLARRRRGARVVGPPLDRRLARGRRRLPDVRRRARRGASGTRAARREVVGDDIFAVLEADGRRDGRRAVVRLPRLRRPPRPARPPPTGDLPDAVWMRAARTCGCSSTPGPVGSGRTRRPAPASDRGSARRGPRSTPRAFARVQEHLRAGNSYEVNLTYRLSVESDLDPVDGVPPAPRRSTPRRTPGSSSTTSRAPGVAAELAPGALRAGRPRDRTIETKPIKGTTPRGATARRTTRCGTRLATRPEVPRREPDDRRPAPQRHRDGRRGGLGRGAGADGRRVLRDRAPAGLDRPRPAPRRRHDGRGAAGAVPAPAR